MSLRNSINAYPQIFIIDGKEMHGSRNTAKGTVLVPYTLIPKIRIGDSILYKTGGGEISLTVTDLEEVEDGTLGVGTIHPHLLTLYVENKSSSAYKNQPSTTTFNIQSVSGQQVQVGESNNLVMNITLQELVEKISKSDDPEAKSLLNKLLNNSTVSGVVGAGASALFAYLSK